MSKRVKRSAELCILCRVTREDGDLYAYVPMTLPYLDKILSYVSEMARVKARLQDVVRWEVRDSAVWWSFDLPTSLDDLTVALDADVLAGDVLDDELFVVAALPEDERAGRTAERVQDRRLVIFDNSVAWKAYVNGGKYSDGYDVETCDVDVGVLARVRAQLLMMEET